MIRWPGAVISGFTLPSYAGPPDEKNTTESIDPVDVSDAAMARTFLAWACIDTL